MPAKQQKRLMQHLMFVYVGLFLVSVALVSLFVVSEYSLHKKIQHISSINDAIHDVDDAVMHLVMSKTDPVQWDLALAPVLFDQAIRALKKLPAERHVDFLQALEAELHTLKHSMDDNNATLSNKIIHTKIQLKSLHQLLMNDIDEQTHKNMMWFYVVLVFIFGLAISLFISLFRSSQKQNSFHQSYLSTQGRLALIVNNMEEVFCLSEKESGKLLYVSPSFQALWGVSLDELCEDPLAWQAKVHPDDLNRFQGAFKRRSEQEDVLDFRVTSSDGGQKWIRQRVFSTHASVSDDGIPKDYVITVSSDITEVRKLNEQLAQSQRLDALGRVTGGVAHDFNNLLTVIIGNAQLIKDYTEKTSPQKMMAELIIKAAERGAKLNRQLLTFAGKQQQQLEYIDLCDVLHDIQHLMNKTLGEDIVLNIHTSPGNIYCTTDAAQLQSAVINLCFNSRDAMPQGGEISISVEQRTTDHAVIIVVSDNGIGIPEHILPLIFEPFFTTKAAKGSGLGLSMVYGFVKQCHGDIEVRSQLGEGTTFRLTLPLINKSIQAEPSVLDTTAVNKMLDTPSGKKCLLVEDNELVRDSVASMLADKGFSIDTAQSCEEGQMKLLESTEYDLLITDVVTPGHMNGIELAEWCKAERPEMRILIVSGYYDDLSYLAEQFHFLAKPFTHNQLLQTLSAVVGQDLLK